MIHQYRRAFELVDGLTDDNHIHGLEFDTIVGDSYIKDGEKVCQRLTFSNGVQFDVLNGFIIGSIGTELIFIEYNPSYTDQDIEIWKTRLITLKSYKGLELQKFWLMI